MSQNGFPEFTGDAALSWPTSRPNTPTVFDEYGNRMAFGITDNADAITDFPIDSRIVEFQQNGVLNGNFARGPADAYHDITDINPMPDWTGPVSVSGGAITAQWADSSSPSGRTLQMTLNPGAASDEAYFEQIVPIGGTAPTATAHFCRVGFVPDTDVAASLTVELQYLDVTGAELGSATNTSSGSFTAVPLVGSVLAVKAAAFVAARFLRIRLHLLRDAAAATADSFVQISDVKVWSMSESLLLHELSSSLVLPSINPTPPSGFASIYAKASDSLLYSKDDAGNERLLSHEYSEGTWTPSLAYATVGTSSWATTTAVGTYTRIGRQVTIQLFYQGVPTNGTGAGNLQLSTLPFTPLNTASTNARFAVSWSGVTKAGYGSVVVNCVPGSTTANFVASGSGVAAAVLAVGDIPSGGTVSFVGSGSFFV